MSRKESVKRFLRQHSLLNTQRPTEADPGREAIILPCTVEYTNALQRDDCLFMLNNEGSYSTNFPGQTTFNYTNQCCYIIPTGGPINQTSPPQIKVLLKC